MSQANVAIRSIYTNTGAKPRAVTSPLIWLCMKTEKMHLEWLGDSNGGERSDKTIS